MFSNEDVYSDQLVFQPFSPLSDYVERRAKAIRRELANLRLQKKHAQEQAKLPENQRKKNTLNVPDHIHHTGGAWDGGGITKFPNKGDLRKRYNRCMARFTNESDMLSIQAAADMLDMPVRDVAGMGMKGQLPMFVLLGIRDAYIPDFALAKRGQGHVVSAVAADVCRLFFNHHTANKRWPDVYCALMERTNVLVPAHAMMGYHGLRGGAVKFMKQRDEKMSVSVPDALRYVGSHPELHEDVLVQVEQHFGIDRERQRKTDESAETNLAVLSARAFDPIAHKQVQPVWDSTNVVVRKPGANAQQLKV